MRLGEAAGVVVAVTVSGCAGILGLGDPQDGGAGGEADASVVGEAAPRETGAADVARSTNPDAGPDAASSPCPANWALSGTTCVLDFGNGWTVSVDANAGGYPMMSETSTPTSVTVTYLGDGDCNCAAEHLSLPLGRTFDCATTTLSFDYATSIAGADYTNSPSLDIRFCMGGCPMNQEVAGGVMRFTGSEYTGHSNCAIYPDYPNTWPAVPAVHQGANVVPLVTLDGGSDGICVGSFDTVDVHVQGYACYASETATSVLSNVRFY
jgi:hypothetical protein